MFVSRAGSKVKVYPHGGAVEFVAELHERYMRRQSQMEGSYGEAPDHPGTVFISYASEDVNAADELHKTLAAASAADHVMLMDLTRSIKAGDSLTLTLTFQHAGKVTLTLPVDNKRQTGSGEGPTPYDAASAKAN